MPSDLIRGRAPVRVKKTHCEGESKTLETSRDLLLLTGEILGRDSPAKPFARLQSLPVGRNRRTELPGESDSLRQQQRISDGNIGSGKSAGTEHVAIGDGGFHTAQPTEEPLVVIRGHLRIAPLFGFKLCR